MVSPTFSSWWRHVHSSSQVALTTATLSCTASLWRSFVGLQTVLYAAAPMITGFTEMSTSLRHIGCWCHSAFCLKLLCWRSTAIVVTDQDILMTSLCQFTLLELTVAIRRPRWHGRLVVSRSPTARFSAVSVLRHQLCGTTFHLNWGKTTLAECFKCRLNECFSMCLLVTGASGNFA